MIKTFRYFILKIPFKKGGWVGATFGPAGWSCVSLLLSRTCAASIAIALKKHTVAATLFPHLTTTVKQRIRPAIGAATAAPLLLRCFIFAAVTSSWFLYAVYTAISTRSTRRAGKIAVETAFFRGKNQPLFYRCLQNSGGFGGLFSSSVYVRRHEKISPCPRPLARTLLLPRVALRCFRAVRASPLCSPPPAPAPWPVALDLVIYYLFFHSPP